MEKASDNNPATDVVESNHPPNPKPTTDTDATATTTEPLYFTKDGKVQFGTTPPSAFALSYPYPPLPSNLAKNRVLRAIDDQTKESVQEGITEAEKEYEKEAMPLPGLTLVHGSPLPKVLISEIELALYWDRHPYEFRVPEQGTVVGKQNGNKINSSASAMRRSKSEMNLASKVGKLLEESSVAGNSNSRSSRRSSIISASNKTIRSTPDTDVSSVVGAVDEIRKELLSPKNSHYEEHLTYPSTNRNHASNHANNGNRCSNGKCDSAFSMMNRRNSESEGSRVGGESSSKMVNGKHEKNGTGGDNVNNKTLQMSESERRKFEDIKLFHHPNGQSQGHGGHSRPRLIRSHEQLENGMKKSAGVQVTIDDVAAAALKSTYLCPLHGQYKRGIERRDKGGFRTDMGAVNVHAHCSRALKGKSSKTKMIKTAETQTDGEMEDSIPCQSRNNNKRSKTAGHARSCHHRGKELMASEYHGSFKDPYKIAESEKRHLRNKILNYCFTKHSIF